MANTEDIKKIVDVAEDATKLAEDAIKDGVTPDEAKSLVNYVKARKTLFLKVIAGLAIIVALATSYFSGGDSSVESPTAPTTTESK